MKHVFIVNPAAGAASALPSLLQRIKFAAEECNIDYEIYNTKTIGDATVHAKEVCANNPDEHFRFYACGGDGTVNGVANALACMQNAELAIIPSGTGNDFVKAFSNLENFNDITKVIKGKVLPMDLIKYGDKYSINILNIGFDCDVVARVEEIKRKPYMIKGMAYPTAVMQVFMKGYGVEFKVETDDGQVFDGEHVLALFANAKYYGGGFKSAPNAYVNDGLMEVVVVDKVSRPNFIKLLPKYKAGTYVDYIDKYPFIHYIRCKKAKFSCNSVMGVCGDGEISPATTLDIEVIPNAINVVCPEGSTCIAYK